jgi:predicted AAA+ superfamily ATPase
MFIRETALLRILRTKSVFLIGPRQTGKTTLLRTLLHEALYLDLLDPRTFQTFAAAPESLVRVLEREAASTSLTVVIDEIQRIPELLNTIHMMIEKRKDLRFVLTGSGARKLRRGGINLLGGRAALIRMHPLCSRELPSWPQAKKDWRDLLQISALPSVLLSPDPEIELRAYTDLYLKEEIQTEANIKNLPEFSRFLSVAAGANGRQIVFEKIGARAGVSGKMAQSWFQLLEDTLFGKLIPTFKETTKREPVSSPKFYLFDVGIARFLQGRFASDPFDDGTDLEAFLLQEILCWRDVALRDVEVSYWRTKSKAEVDLVLSLGAKHVAIEVKTTRRLTEHDFSGLKLLGEEEDLSVRRVLVNPHVLSQKREDAIEILSVDDFLTELWEGKLFE